MVARARTAESYLTTAEVLGLLTACPWTQTNPTECRLHEVRKLPLAELYAMIRHAEPGDLEEFAGSCVGCLHRCPRYGAH